jgi:hypothetical protein
MQQKQQELGAALTETSSHEQSLSRNVELLLKRTKEIEEEDEKISKSTPEPVNMKNAASLMKMKSKVKEIIAKKMNIKNKGKLKSVLVADCSQSLTPK